MEFRFVRSFKTMPVITEHYGAPAQMVKQEVSKVLQVRASEECDWVDIPVVDFDEDTGQYIELEE